MIEDNIDDIEYKQYPIRRGEFFGAFDQAFTDEIL